MPLMRDECLSASDLSRKTKSVLDDLEGARRDHFYVIRNNKPCAVLVSMTEYEDMLERAENAHLLTIALEREDEVPTGGYLDEADIFGSGVKGELDDQVPSKGKKRR